VVREIWGDQIYPWVLEGPQDLLSFVRSGNEGTKLCNQQGLVLEIGLYDETMMRINPKGLRRQLDLKVPERPLQLRVSSPDRKEKKSATIMYRENTTSTGTTSFIAGYMASMQGHA